MTRFLPLLLLASCGSYHLATDIRGHEGVQQRLDIVECREVARDWSARPGAQARGFATGLLLPVVGIAVDYQAIKSDRRAEFGRCMTDRGYTLVVGRD